MRVLRIVSAHDSGRIINPTLAESQLEGGIIQGLGYALFEERVLDARSASPLNPTMHDYKIPTIGDMPTIDAFFVDRADVVANHTGAKGLAEPPIIRRRAGDRERGGGCARRRGDGDSADAVEGDGRVDGWTGGQLKLMPSCRNAVQLSRAQHRVAPVRFLLQHGSILGSRIVSSPGGHQ